MKMFSRIKAHWRESRRAPLGKRFQRLNALRKDGAKRRSRWLRIALIAIAIALLLVALVLAFIPGPAFIFAIPAFTLLAAEFLWAARLLDACEKTAHPVTRRGQRLWDRLSRNQKIAAIASVTACSVTLVVIGLL